MLFEKLDCVFNSTSAGLKDELLPFSKRTFEPILKNVFHFAQINENIVNTRLVDSHGTDSFYGLAFRNYQRTTPA